VTVAVESRPSVLARGTLASRSRALYTWAHALCRRSSGDARHGKSHCFSSLKRKRQGNRGFHQRLRMWMPRDRNIMRNVIPTHISNLKTVRDSLAHRPIFGTANSSRFQNKVDVLGYLQPFSSCNCVKITSSVMFLSLEMPSRWMDTEPPPPRLKLQHSICCRFHPSNTKYRKLF